MGEPDVTWASVMAKPTNRVALATQLKAARKAAHRAQDAFAVEFGLTLTQVRQLESGAVQLTPGHVRFLAGHLGTTVHFLTQRLSTTAAVQLVNLINQALPSSDFVGLFTKPVSDPLEDLDTLIAEHSRIGQRLVVLRDRLRAEQRDG